MPFATFAGARCRMTQIASGTEGYGMHGICDGIDRDYWCIRKRSNRLDIIADCFRRYVAELVAYLILASVKRTCFFTVNQHNHPIYWSNVDSSHFREGGSIYCHNSRSPVKLGRLAYQVDGDLKVTKRKNRIPGDQKRNSTHLSDHTSSLPTSPQL